MCDGCSTVMDLEVKLASLSLFGSLSSLPFDLDQIIFYEKVGWLNQDYVPLYFNHSINHNKHTQNAMQHLLRLT